MKFLPYPSLAQQIYQNRGKIGLTYSAKTQILDFTPLPKGQTSAHVCMTICTYLCICKHEREFFERANFACAYNELQNSPISGGGGESEIRGESKK